jgi:hypothetical protein
LQREILEHLKTPLPPERGSLREGETKAYQHAFIPAENVYDLRHVLKVVSKIRRSGANWNEAAFQSAFSRAVRSLVARGVLKPLWLVPISGVCFAWQNDPRWRTESLADGEYMVWSSRQVRFVQLTTNLEEKAT